MDENELLENSGSQTCFMSNLTHIILKFMKLKKVIFVKVFVKPH